MAFIYTISVAQQVTSINGISHSLQATGDSHYLNIAFTVDTGTCGTNITSLVSSIELHHIDAVCNKLYGMRYSKQLLQRTPTEENRVKQVELKCLRYFREFAEVTTLHGVRYLAEKNRSLIERVFWALALVLASCSCWYFVLLVSQQYHSTPVIVTVTTLATATSAFPSPAVTVCSTSHRSGAGDFTQQGNLSSDVGFLYCEDNERQEEFLNNESLRDVLQGFRASSQRMMVSVRHAGQELAPLAEYVQTFITPASVCITHNMLPLQQLFRTEYLQVYEYYGLHDGSAPWRQGREHAWTPSRGFYSSAFNTTPVRLSGDSYKSNTQYVLNWDGRGATCDQNGDRLVAYFHSPANMPAISQNSVLFRSGYQVSLCVTPWVTVSDSTVMVWTPLERGCYYDHERYLRFFKIYTKRNCKVECEANITLAHCGCALFSHPRNLSTPVCGPKRRKCVNKTHREFVLTEKATLDCSCWPSCDEIKYEVDPRVSPWKSFTQVSSNHSISNSFSRIKLIVKKKYINLTKRTAMMGTVTYLASIGGIFSLFLGIGFLSTFEIFYFVSLRVLVNEWNSRNILHKRRITPQPRSWRPVAHP